MAGHGQLDGEFHWLSDSCQTCRWRPKEAYGSTCSEEQFLTGPHHARPAPLLTTVCCIAIAPHPQLHHRLKNGMQLQVPPRDELPGADTASFAGLDDYITLMRWVHAVGLHWVALHAIELPRRVCLAGLASLHLQSVRLAVRSCRQSLKAAPASPPPPMH